MAEVLRSERVALGDGIRPATLVIEDGKITTVLAPGESPPADAGVTDLGDDLVVPGLIDCHTHLFLDDLQGDWAYERQLITSLPLRTLRGAAAARKMLDFGFTTVRDVCTEGAAYADVALALAVREGVAEGPRIVPSGPGIGITGGYMPKLAPGGCLPTG